MRRKLLLMGLAGAVAASPALANAQPYFGNSCWGHRVGGAVLGGVGGGAIGAALAAGVAVTPWAWAAAGVGALVGHAIGVARCRHWAAAYYGPYGYPPPYPYYHPAYGYYHPAYGYHPAYAYYRGYPQIYHVHHYHHRRAYYYAVEYSGPYAAYPG